MQRPLGLDIRPSARTGGGSPGLGGLILSAVGALLALIGLRRRSVPGGLLALLGAGLAYRGLTGMDAVERLVDPKSAAQPVQFPATESTPADHTRSAATTINRDREPVYGFWRDPANLTLLHGPIEGITVVDDGRQRWRLAGPAGPAVELDMRSADDVPFERLAWESVGDGPIPMAGRPVRIEVSLSDAPGGRGTEVRLSLRLPGGPIAGGLERLVGPALEAQLRESLRRARQLLEVGEIATTDGQASARQADGAEISRNDTRTGEPAAAGEEADREGERSDDRQVAAIEAANW
ncbi:MAG TPA: hypothetical protein VKA85_03375 [Candidatus Limnocylindrales bacterium]|nr:hypothetical protein [Candidatus Limnocylindrales bacterium]